MKTHDRQVICINRFSLHDEIAEVATEASDDQGYIGRH